MAPQLSAAFLREFIELYQSFPCLWKVKSAEYSNKHLREEAYKQLVEFCKTDVPDADKEFVQKKINSLRGAFRKEMKKVKASNRSGIGAEDVYTPKLWYYDLLLFTSDQEESREAFDSIEHESNSQLEEESQDESTNSIDIEVIEKDEGSQLPLRITARKISTPTHLKGTTKKEIKAKEDFYKQALDTLSKSEDEFSHFASCTAAKLRKMDPLQRIHCENLINMAIYKGTLGYLNENYVLQPQTHTQTSILPANNFALPSQINNWHHNITPQLPYPLHATDIPSCSSTPQPTRSESGRFIPLHNLINSTPASIQIRETANETNNYNNYYDETQRERDA